MGGKSRFARVVVALAFLAATPASSRMAHAGPKESQLAEARSRFQQALALQAAGDWSGALALLEKVASVASTAQVHFNIALCQEKLGKLSAALGNYRIAASLAHQANVADVEKQSTEKLADIEGRLPKLVITRGSNAGAAQILLDGTELGTSAIGRELPVDPGPHQIEARPPGGGKPTMILAELVESDRKSIEVSLKEEPGVTAPPAAPPSVVGAPEESGSGGKALMYSGFGVALVGAAVGSVTGILAFSKEGDLESSCSPEKECLPPIHDDLSSARSMATISTVSFIVAGVGATVGVVGLFTRKSSSSKASIHPFVGIGRAGLGGSF